MQKSNEQPKLGKINNATPGSWHGDSACKENYIL